MNCLILLMLFLHTYVPEFKSKECDDETPEETHEDDDTKVRPVNQTNSHNSTDGEDPWQNLQQPTLTEPLLETLTGSPTSSSNYSMNAQDEGAKDTIIDIDRLSSKINNEELRMEVTQADPHCILENENGKNRKEVKDREKDSTEFGGSPRNVTEPGTCKMANQMKVENKKDHSYTKSNGSTSDAIIYNKASSGVAKTLECGPSTEVANFSSTESVNESKENDATLVKLGEMLSKYLREMLWKDLTQDADQKKNCQLIKFCLDPSQELQEKKSEFGVYFGHFILKWGKLPEIEGSMQEAKRFVGDMNLTHGKSYTLTRKLFFYAFFINIFLLQWDSSECDSTFRTRYYGVKDDLVAVNNQIPFAILKKVHGWIADTWKAENPIPDLTVLILRCLLDQNCSASLTGKSDDVSHLLELFYKAYTEKWGTTKNCGNDVGDTKKRTGFACAKELKENGIKFDVKDTYDLLDISFERGTLKIPFLITDQRFLFILKNLVLYEKLVGGKKPVTSLVCFLTCLIQTEDDIRILHNAGIKEKACNDKELPGILSDIYALARLNYQYHRLSGISYDIDQFYLKKMNKWYHGCYKNYCYNPTAIMLSVLGAVAYLFYIFNGVVNVDHLFHGKNHSP